jgi:transcriptional regulator with XRE-family HTH domain/mannose-6-phosphate isomerase-like protein (cupin superfamily)
VTTVRGPSPGTDGTRPARARRQAADVELSFTPDRREPVAGVGAQLRERRQAAGLSLRQFAKTLGVSASFISQLENGKSQPSVATLYQICSALGVTVDELFAALDTPDPRPSASAASAKDVPALVSRAHIHGFNGAPADDDSTVNVSAPVVGPDRRQKLVLDSGVTWEQLSAIRETAVDFMFVRYDVGGSSVLEEQLIRHSGVEYGYVISGELAVTLGFDVYRVRPGEAISFDSTTPHRLDNVGQVPVEAIWFVHGRNAKHEH